MQWAWTYETRYSSRGEHGYRVATVMLPVPTGQVEPFYEAWPARDSGERHECVGRFRTWREAAICCELHHQNKVRERSDLSHGRSVAKPDNPCTAGA